jgi:hypothetical protein
LIDCVVAQIRFCAVSKMSLSSSTTTIPVFDGKNFLLWRIKVEAYLDSKEWAKYTIGATPVGVAAPAAADKAAPAAVDKAAPAAEVKVDQERCKAYNFIVSCLSYEVLALVAAAAKSKDPVQLWKALLAEYDRDTDASKHALREQMLSQRLADGENVSVYISRIDSCHQRLAAMGDTISKDDLRFSLFRGLPDEYESYVTTMRAIKADYTTACQHLRDQYELVSLKRSQESSSGAAALLAGHHGRDESLWCDIHKVNGHSTSKCSFNMMNTQSHQGGNTAPHGPRIANHAGGRNGKFRSVCWTCGEKGHMQRDCPKKKQAPSSAYGKKGAEEKGMQASDTSGGPEYSACVLDDVDEKSLAASGGEGNSMSDYILDAGATSHFINDLSALYDVVKLDQSKFVTVANNQKVQINQIGKMKLKGNNGAVITLTDVRYVPTFTTNLISVARLTKNGATVLYNKEKAVVTAKDGVVLLTARCVNELYYIKGPGVNTSQSDSANRVSDDLSLFHQRVGHLSLSTIKHMVDADAIAGADHLKHVVSQADVDVSQYMCEGCAKGKSHRHAFAQHSHKPAASAVGDRLYGDLSGPIKLSVKELEGVVLTIFRTLGSPVYFSALVDEISRYISGALLKNKSDAATHVKGWINHTETLQHKPVKYFHSDGGGEYINNYLAAYFLEKGIMVEQTCAHTPQHNAIVERANRIVFEMARSMLMHAGLHSVFWGPAVLTACYLMNLRLCVNDKTKSAYEMWHGHKPPVKHLRVFGCDAFVHVPKDDRRKMDPKAIKGIFIGYDRVRENGYRVYDITNHRVIVSRDVMFYEKNFTAAHSIVPNGAAGSESDASVTLSDSVVLQWVKHNPPPVLPTMPVPASALLDADHELEAKYNNNAGNDGSTSPVSVSVVPPVDIAIVPSRVDNSTSILSWDAPAALQQSQPSTVPTTAVRRSGRVPKSRHGSFSIAYAVADENEPKTYAAALASPDVAQWKKAIDDEISSLNENGTFGYVKRSSLPIGANIMDYRWVFKIKRASDGTIEKFKARLVAKGFTQKEGVDYTETYAPTLRYKSLRIILALANAFKYKLVQMDVVTAFLYADADEIMYMRVPEGFERGGDDIAWVLLLNKSLYGTKQAPHLWNKNVNEFTVSVGFTRLVSDACVYVKRTDHGMIIMSIFVDDLVIAYDARDEKDWLAIKQSFMTKYKMKDLGEVSWILGMKLTRDWERGVMCLDQSLYVSNVLKRFDMYDCKPVPTPECESVKLSRNDCPVSDEDKKEMGDMLKIYQEAVGSLLYASTGTRPDIAHAVNVVSKYNRNPGQAHWMAVKRIFRYLKGTINQPLVFIAKDTLLNGQLNVSVFSDADWAGDVDDRRSTSGYVVRIGQSTVMWSTKKQKTVSLSSAEAEYMALSTAVQEVMWLRRFLCEMLDVSGMSVRVCMSVFVDNQAALHISKNDVYHDRTKHIDIRYHFVREAVKDGLFQLLWVPTHQQLADGLTKALGTVLFAKLTSSVMNCP